MNCLQEKFLVFAIRTLTLNCPFMGMDLFFGYTMMGGSNYNILTYRTSTNPTLVMSYDSLVYGTEVK
jgi:hypothetical protein